MAFSERALIRTGSVPYATNAAVSTYRYGTPDAAAAVETAGYLNPARGRLVVGDAILATVGIGGAIKLKAYLVTAVPATGDVTVGLMTTAAG